MLNIFFIFISNNFPIAYNSHFPYVFGFYWVRRDSSVIKMSGKRRKRESDRERERQRDRERETEREECKRLIMPHVPQLLLLRHQKIFYIIHNTLYICKRSVLE